MIDTNLEIDGRKVFVTDAGMFSVSVGNEVLLNARFDRLEKDIERHLEEVAEKAEHQRNVALRRALAAKTPVWVRENGWGHLVPAVYRGRHATTGATLLTFADGSKPVGKKFFTLYVNLTAERVNEVNALLDRVNDLDKQVIEAKQKSVDGGERSKLSAHTSRGVVQVVHDKYSHRNRKDVATIPFTANGQILSVVVDDDVLSAYSAHDLEAAVVQRLHPSYGKPVWIVDNHTSSLAEQVVPFRGDVLAHVPEGDDRYYHSDILAFEEKADAEEFLRLKNLRVTAGEEFRLALHSLPKLDDPEHDED